MINTGIDMYLNVAGGKFLPLKDKFPDFSSNIPKGHLINVDLSYSYFSTKVPEIPLFIMGTSYYNEDIYKFLENIQIGFKGISIYRFMEHVALKDLLYFIYLLSTATRKGSFIDIIVPNYKILAEKIINEDTVYTKMFKDDCPYNHEFQAHDILVTTELLNEPSCPHASIWTPRRAKYYFELEGRFKVKDIIPNFEFDGRDIYLRFTAERI